MSEQDNTTTTQIRVKQHTLKMLTDHLESKRKVLLRLSWPELMDVIVGEWIQSDGGGTNG